MEIYYVNTVYINYLRHKADRNVLTNEQDGRLRPYVGVVFTINSFNYFVPLSSPKPSDYILINGISTIRKSIVPIHRIIITDCGEIDFFGKLKFSNMIPIPNGEFRLLDIQGITDIRYKSIIENQIRYIRKHKDMLMKNHANVIYQQKTKNLPIGYLKSTVDFRLLEQVCNEYEIITQNLAEPALQAASGDDTLQI